MEVRLEGFQAATSTSLGGEFGIGFASSGSYTSEACLPILSPLQFPTFLRSRLIISCETSSSMKIISSRNDSPG